MIDNTIWMLGTSVNVLIWAAMIKRDSRITSPYIFWSEFLSATFLVGQNVVHIFHLHGESYWYLFDQSNILVELAIFYALASIPDRSGVGRWLPLGYVAGAVATIYEYKNAEEGSRLLANHIYYGRTILGLFTSLALAYCIYCRKIGKPYQGAVMEELDPLDTNLQEDAIDQVAEQSSDDGDDDGGGVPPPTSGGPH